MAKMAKMKFVEKNHLMSLKLSKFTLSTAQQLAAYSDDQLKSYGQKTAFFGQNGQNGHNFLTGHWNALPIAALYSG